MKSELRSECTGTVIELNCQPGDRVPAGSPIITIDSMKMEIGLTSAFPVHVVGFKVSVGQVVSEGDVVAVIESACT